MHRQAIRQTTIEKTEKLLAFARAARACFAADKETATFSDGPIAAGGLLAIR